MPALVLPPWAGAHGELHERIAGVTRQIELHPDRADLYFLRAELHHFHEDWDASLADFEQAGQLYPDLELLHLARARMLLDAGWPLSARRAADRFLESHRDHPEALQVRARALAKGGQPLAAAADFSRAITQIPKPNPDLYLERAVALAAAGEEHLGAAVHGLDEGMQRLGPLVTLQLQAIELEVQRRCFDAALARLDAQAARSPRQETWLARRGDILRQAGRHTEAQAAYRQSLDAIEALPSGLRNVPSIGRLTERVQNALNEYSPAEAKPFADPPAGIRVNALPPASNNSSKHNSQPP